MTLLSDPSSPMNEAACVRLCAAFANHIDARRYERVLDLFTDDAVLDRMGHLVTGRAAISAFLEARPTTVETRHLCTNIEVDLLSVDEAVGTCCVLFFQGTPAADAISQALGPPAIVEYHDRFQRTPRGWRIRERRILMAMKPASTTLTN